MASTLLRAARKASIASRAAAAAASRAAALASRSARAAGVAVAAAHAAHSRELNGRAARGEASKKLRDDAPWPFFSDADYALLPDDAKTPTDKDFESDEALRSLYERWCKAFNKKRDQRDHAEMASRFKLFRYSAKSVHYQNTFVPADPEKAAIYHCKRREVKLLLSKGEDVSHIDECFMPMELGPFADGGDPCFSEHQKRLLKSIEENPE